MKHPISVFAFVACLASMATLPTHARADGALDPLYGAGGRQTVAFNLGGNNTDQAFASVLQPDGKLVIAGAASLSGGDQDFAVVRLLANGSRDPEFGDSGRVTVHLDLFSNGSHNNVARGVALQSDGKIVLVGTADGNWLNAGAGASSMALVRLLPNGTRDPSFGNYNGAHFPASPYDTITGTALTVLASGEIVAVGSIATGAGATSPFVDYVDGSGNDILQGYAFAPDAMGTATSVGADANGRVIISGHYRSASQPAVGYDCFVVASVLDPATGLFVADPTFGANASGSLTFGRDRGVNNNDLCWSQSIQADGKIVLVGQSDLQKPAFNTLGGSIYRVLADGSALDSFITYYDSAGAFMDLRAVKTQADHKLVVAGYLANSDPARAPYDFVVARFLADAKTADPAFFPQAPESVFGTGFVWVGFEELNANAQGEDDGAFALSLDGSGHIYVIGQDQVAGTDYDMAVARLQTDEIFINSFEPVLP